jgi:hypothetical protein
MKGSTLTDLMAERIDSLKAAIIGAFCLLSTFILFFLLNIFLLREYLGLSSPKVIWDWNFLVGVGIAGFSGFLFGVTYRYIIRDDNNPHLKSGGIVAFGLVRGLAQIDVGWNATGQILPYIFIASESILGVAIAGLSVDLAIRNGWLKAMS